MKHFIFFLVSSLACLVAMAQESQKYVVRGGTRPRDTFTFEDIYVFPAFTTGKVYFKNTHVGAGMMNYNRFTGEIDFITGKDTLALADQETIKNVVIGNDVFYYQVDAGFVKRLDETTYGTFAKKEIIKLADRRRHPNSGSSGAASNGSYNSMITTGAGVASGLALNMVESVDLIYRKATDYYFANSKGFFVTAEKKNLLRLYSGKKASLNAYFESHNVDFQNEESLRDLFKAINEMQ